MFFAFCQDLYSHIIDVAKWYLLQQQRTTFDYILCVWSVNQVLHDECKKNRPMQIKGGQEYLDYRNMFQLNVMHAYRTQ